jgi:hypothetical protein
MKFNIVNHESESFTESVGISQERADFLGKMMDNYSNTLQGQTVRTCDVFAEISAWCNSLEEVIFCTISHCNYMALNYGIFLCPPKKRK